MILIRYPLSAVILVAALSGTASAQLQSFRVATGFTNPVFATSAPGEPDRLYVVEQAGVVKVLELSSGLIQPVPFLNLNNAPGTFGLISGGEQGLLGLAFHPDYAQNGQFYINYTTSAQGGGSAGFTRVDRLNRQDFYQADLNSRSPVLSFQQDFTNHNGGWIGFSPKDRFLYIASGDGGSGWDPNNRAQSLDTRLGKMLRVDVNGDDFPGNPNENYRLPTGPGVTPNPFSGAGQLREIWAYGLRNPYRSSFDRLTGDLYIGDVGQRQREEIDFQAANSAGGLNYGWRTREGFIATDNGVGGPFVPGLHTDPIHDYDRTQGNSVTGGYVYRGGTYLDGGQPLDGTYFFADFGSSQIWKLRYDGSTVSGFLNVTGALQNAINGGSIGSISSFGEDGFGNLYVLDYFGGEVFRIQSASAVPEPGSMAFAGLILASGGAWWRYRRREQAVST